MMRQADSIELDHNKLRGLIYEKYGTIKAFSKEIGLSASSVSQRLNGRISFSPKEIMSILPLLGLAHDDIDTYFFNQKVHKTKQMKIAG